MAGYMQRAAEKLLNLNASVILLATEYAVDQ